MKPPIVESFEDKVKQEAIKEYVRRDKQPLPTDEILVLVLCVFAIVWAGAWAVLLVLFNLAYLSYVKTINCRIKKIEEEENNVQDIE